MTNEVIKQRLRILYQERKISNLDSYVEKGLLTAEEAASIERSVDGNK